MATSFFNDNQHRAYPFVRETVNRIAGGPATTLNLPNAIIVDAGFTLNVNSGFETGEHAVYLEEIRRIGDNFYFVFGSDAPDLFDTVLTFTRTTGSDTHETEIVDSGEAGLPEGSLSAGSISEVPCDGPLWSGFLTTGPISALVLLLPGDGTISRGASASIVEPALLQNLAGTYVAKLGLANDDRTRATAADGCPEQTFPGPIDVLHIAANCIIGHVAIRPGYNCTITQNANGNSITIGADVGAGDGEPCREVPLYPGEHPPADSSLLEGGLRCYEVVRSFNGIGGQQFSILAGNGVNVTSVPGSNRVIIGVDMSGLALCADGLSQVSESC